MVEASALTPEGAEPLLHWKLAPAIAGAFFVHLMIVDASLMRASRKNR
jgi:hypothetical protein